MLRGRSPTSVPRPLRRLRILSNVRPFFDGELHSQLVLYRSPPCVRGPDVIEVTHGLAATTHTGWLGCREPG
jgi:hypothetical protein